MNQALIETREARRKMLEELRVKGDDNVYKEIEDKSSKIATILLSRGSVLLSKGEYILDEDNVRKR